MRTLMITAALFAAFGAAVLAAPASAAPIGSGAGVVAPEAPITAVRVTPMERRMMRHRMERRHMRHRMERRMMRRHMRHRMMHRM